MEEWVFDVDWKGVQWRETIGLSTGGYANHTLLLTSCTAPRMNEWGEHGMKRLKRSHVHRAWHQFSGTARSLRAGEKGQLWFSPMDSARGSYLLHDTKGRNEQARGDGGESPDRSAES